MRPVEIGNERSPAWTPFPAPEFAYSTAGPSRPRKCPSQPGRTGQSKVDRHASWRCRDAADWRDFRTSSPGACSEGNRRIPDRSPTSITGTTSRNNCRHRPSTALRSGCFFCEGRVVARVPPRGRSRFRSIRSCKSGSGSSWSNGNARDRKIERCCARGRAIGASSAMVLIWAGAGKPR